jgi:hypothetical protein
MQPYKRSGSVKERSQFQQSVPDYTALAAILREVITSIVPSDCDYKEHISEVSYALCVALQLYVERKTLIKQANKLGLFDGYSCPRSTWVAVSKLLA